MSTESGTTIVLVRHGQTAWNRDDRFRGRTDLELTELGLQQVEAVAASLADVPLAAVYSSPQRRAVQTATAIAARHGLPVRLLAGIDDIDYGAWQGLSSEETAARYPELYHLWLTGPHQVQFPAGESVAALMRRASAALAEVARAHSGETVVLVSHRAVCQVLGCYCLGLDESHLWCVTQDVANISRFQVGPDRITVLQLNDTCHLRGLRE